MTSDTYKAALDQSRHALAHAIQQRDFWNLEIVRAQNAVRSMAAMLANVEAAEQQEREMQKQIGIAQAIEALVNGAPSPLTSLEVKNGLNFYGYDIERYQNPVSLIYQTLHRLAEGGRIKQLPDNTFTRNDFYQALLNTNR